ncbi:hypothetical protein BX600DRAFT_316958 [Xylariales sp. PMI_506]|nr:hypothetical protein BX600DRAFT_316958 [Xylariales sp. PMI_506]
MRPSNAFWLLAGSSLSAAAPIVLFKTQGSPTQITMSAKFGLEEAGSHISPKVSNTQNIPPLDLPEARPDNRPYMPSEDVTPSEALTSPQPLTTTYLLSLKPDSDQKETSQPSANLDLPSNSIALEETGAADVPITLSIVQLETQGNEPVYYKVPCTMHIGAGHFHVVRVYADSSVVGLACVFLALVALVELWGPVSRL